MSLTRAIAGNSAVQIGGKFIGALLGILTVAVMTRHLGREGYGQFTTAISFLQFFGILVDFGLTLTMIRLLARPDTDENRVASNIMTLRFVSGLVFYGLAAVLGLAFPYPAVIKAGIAVGSLSFLCITVSQTLTGVFQKHLAVRYVAAAEVAGRMALFVGVVLASWLGYGVLAVIWLLVLGNVIQLALSFLFARRLLRLRWACDWPLWKEIIRESWPIGVSIAFNLVYLKGDVIILSLIRSQAEVGLYGAAYKILDVVTIVPTVFMGLVLPVLAASWSAGDRADFSRKLGRAFDALSILALPLAFGALAVAADLMSFVAGRDFAASGPYLAVLMLAGAMVFWSALFGHAIVALGAQRKMIWGYAADALISVALYLALIHRYGAAGAAWVTFFSEAFIAVATGVVVARLSGRWLSLRIFWRAFLAAAIMAGALVVLPLGHVLIRVAVGGVIYFGLLFAFGGLDRETVRSLLRLRPMPPVVPAPSPPRAGSRGGVEGPPTTVA